MFELGWSAWLFWRGTYFHSTSDKVLGGNWNVCVYSLASPLSHIVYSPLHKSRVDSENCENLYLGYLSFMHVGMIEKMRARKVLHSGTAHSLSDFP